MSAARSLQARQSPLVPHINPLVISFRDSLDIKATFSSSFRDMKMEYNDSRKKDRIKEGETTTAKILTTLLIEEMDYLRKNQPKDYLFYLSGNIDSMPVMTNRGQLRTMMDEEYSLRTYSNFIKRLTAAKFILRKSNTSRMRTKVIEEDGTVRYEHKIAKNGRGDFKLFINKKALSFRYSFVEKPENLVLGLNSKAIENQLVSLPKTQKLQQPLNELKETLKINNNNPLTGVEKGVAEPQHSKVSCEQERMLKRRDEEGSMQKNNSAAENPKKNLHKTILKSFSKERNLDISTKGQTHLDKLSKDHEISRQLPEDDQNYYATLLFFQMIKLLYTHFADNYIEAVAPSAKNLLRLHLQRLNLPMELAFQTISRAINMTKQHLDTHENAYVYAPLTWLRVDDEYQSGTLKIVVDKWIPKEQKRLKVVKTTNQQFVNWQYAYHASDQLFMEVTKGMKKGFSTGLATYNAAFEKLDYYFDKYELPTPTRDRMRQQFADRTYAILEKVDALDESNKPDKTWSAFKLFQQTQYQCSTNVEMTGKN